MTSSRCGSNALHAAMDRNGWPAVLVYGDVREHAALAYLSNFIPRVRWGMALLPRSGRRASSVRHEHARSAGDAHPDVDRRRALRHGPGMGKGFDPWFEPLKAERTVELGTIGFDIMAPVLHQSVQRSLGERFVLRRADDDLTMPPQRKRPRELTMMRASCKLLQTAATGVYRQLARTAESRRRRRSMPNASRARSAPRMCARW